MGNNSTQDISDWMSYIVDMVDERNRQLVKEYEESGKPQAIYSYNDIVMFHIIDENNVKRYLVGSIGVVDRYGTFEQNEEPSYDIMVYNWENTDSIMFVKHIRQSNIKCKLGKADKEVAL